MIKASAKKTLKKKMKIDFKTKFTYFIGTLLTALIGVCLIFCAFKPDIVFGEDVGLFSMMPLLSLIFGVVLVAFSMNLFLMPRKIKRMGNESFVIQQTSSGILRISKQAIESIILKCASQQEDISLLNITTDIIKDGVVVKININVAEDAAIPVAVDNLQKQVIAQLNNIAGISQSKVIVSVDETTAFENVVKKQTSEERQVKEHLFEEQTNEEQPIESKTDGFEDLEEEEQ